MKDDGPPTSGVCVSFIDLEPKKLRPLVQLPSSHSPRCSEGDCCHLRPPRPATLGARTDVVVQGHPCRGDTPWPEGSIQAIIRDHAYFFPVPHFGPSGRFENVGFSFSGAP